MDHPSSTEDRIWSVLAHLSALAMGMGLILPVIGWAEQRRKSKYVAFQCLQALGYQTLGYTVWILGYLVLLVVLFTVLLLLIALAGDDGETLVASSIIGLNAFIFVSVFASLGVYLVIPVIAAVACALGRDFRFPFMGHRLAKYLNYSLESESELDETREDRWVAAAGHFSVLIALWGLLAPVTAWIMQGKRSAWLKFQSAQAIALHASVLLLGAAAGTLYFFGFIVFIALTGLAGDSAMSSSTGLIALLVLFGSMGIALLIFLLVPLFHIMGQWAGYRVLKGDDYRYPMLGKLVEKLLQGRTVQQPLP